MGSSSRRDRVEAFPPAESFLPRPRFNVGSPICFLHQAKTAGTTVRLTVENAFRGEDIFPSGSSAYAGRYLSLKAALEAGDDLNKFAFLTGHYGWDITSYLSPDANLFAWFREPLDLAVSSFFFRVLQERHKQFAPLLQRIDAGERLETVFVDWVREVYQNPFESYAAWFKDCQRWREANPDTRPQDVVIDMLRGCFFIGLVADHERSLDGLCALTYILPPKQRIKRNVGVKRNVGLRLTLEEQSEFNAILAPETALYERVLEVYELQMEDLKNRANDNAALSLIGDREALRQHILRRPEAVEQRKLTQWDAWDPVQGENLDSREDYQDEHGDLSRWRWTAPMPDTYLYFNPPRVAFRISLRLYPATPLENARNAELTIAGHRIELALETKLAGRHDLVGEVSADVARRLPDVVEFHIHTPVMFDESQGGYNVGTRMLGLAIENISAEPLRKQSLRHFLVKRIRRILSGNRFR